jgi:hypothetical protein
MKQLKIYSLNSFNNVYNYKNYKKSFQKKIFYDYNQLYNHLGHVVIDFLVAKDINPSNEWGLVVNLFHRKSITKILRTKLHGNSTI